MGSSSTKTKENSTTQVTIPQEIRDRGTTLTNAAMGSYFDPNDPTKGFTAENPAYGQYKTIGQNTTGSLNQYNGQGGAAAQSFNAASTDYQPYYNAATAGVTAAGQNQASGYNGNAQTQQGYGANANTSGYFNDPTNTASGYGGQTNTSSGYYGPSNTSGYFNDPTNTASGYNGPAGGAQGIGGNVNTASGVYANPNVNRSTNLASQTASGVGGPNYNSQSLSQFQNPYQQSVIDQGVSQIGQDLNAQMQQNGDAAAKAGAFGGARHGIIDSQSQKNAATTLSNFIGSQLSQGYQNSQNQFNTNYNQGLQANSQSNAAAGQNFNQGMALSAQNNAARQQNLGNVLNINQANNNAGSTNFNQNVTAAGLNNQANAQDFSQYLQANQQNNTAAGQNFNQSLAANAQNNAAGANNFSQLMQQYGLNNAAGTTNFNQGLASQQLANQAAGQNYNQSLGALQQNNQAGSTNFSQGLQQNAQNNATAAGNFSQLMAQYGLNNQAAGQNYTQDMGVANALQGLGTAYQGADLAAGNANMAYGNNLTAADQAAKTNSYNYGYMGPMDVYNNLAAMNAMQPINRTSTTNGTSTTSTSGGWLGPALGAAGSIISASDERIKENIEDVDAEDILGAFAKIPPKSYDYKPDVLASHPEITAPGRRTGYMAQDLEKAFGRPAGPTIDGIKTVDMAELLGRVTTAIHGLEKRTRSLAPKRRSA